MIEELQNKCKTIQGVKGLSKEETFYAYEYANKDIISIPDECFSLLCEKMCCI